MKNSKKSGVSSPFSPLALALACASSLPFFACDVQPTGGDTGGISPGGMGGQANEGEARGFIVVNTDYDSANISLLDLDGKVLSESFLSSSSAAAGLSSALSGDVVLPSSSLLGDELVAIDRSGVLTWVNFQDGEVRAQLSVATGFAAYPHDYVPVSSSKAYVIRFGGNLDSGKTPFDAGNDVLIIDPSVPKITGSIDLLPVVQGEDKEILPRADRALLAGGRLRVLAIAMSANYEKRAETRLVSIDPETDEIEDIAVIEQFSSCSSLAVSPNGDKLAIACNGAFGQDPEDGFPDAGLVVFDTAPAPRELSRYSASVLGGEQIGGVEFVDDDLLVYTTTGRFNADRSAMAAPDTVRLLSLSAKEGSDPVLESEAIPFVLGDVRCAPARHICLVADAESEGGAIHHLTFSESGSVRKQKRLFVDQTLGLPPRYLGVF